MFKFFSVVYIHAVEVSRLSYYKSIMLGFVTAVKDAYPSCMTKAKIYLNLHLPEIMIQFGPPSAYNTERYSDYLTFV